METFTDYYAVLGVDAHATPETIKSAFKKLALQFHPDVYKGEDAEERMRLLLLAYQTLSDTDERGYYDRQRARQLGLDYESDGAHAPIGNAALHVATSSRHAASDARFAFPTLDSGASSPVEFTIEGMVFKLWPDDALLLQNDGMLRGDAPSSALPGQGAAARVAYQCHRCHHRWNAPAQERRPATCPSCHASDWAEYMLLRCTRCRAIFESRELRDSMRGGQLYFPYELFPLCPNCRRPQWCPAENERVQVLRAADARRKAILLAVSVIVMLLIFVGLALTLAR